jgi:uncharacterized paraquat-inducible protein A
MSPVYPRQPKKGFDGLYRCDVCGTLMTEARFRCPGCQKRISAAAKKNLTRVLLCLLIAALIALGVYYIRGRSPRVSGRWRIVELRA